MSWDEERRRSISITKWQALFNHEGSVWETDYASVRTTYVDGTPCDDVTIKRKVATYISDIKRQEISYSRIKAGIAQNKAGRTPPTTKQIQQTDDYEEFFDGLGISDPLELSEMDADAQTSTDPVGPQDIDLIEVTDRSQIHVDIFPLTFRCRRCGHYYFNSGENTNLICPDCAKKSKGENSAVSNIRMKQEPLIFVCPHCANIEELTPSRTNVKDARNGAFDCPKGCGGHLHLHRWGRLGSASWRCSKCNYSEQPIRRNCGCSIYSDDPDSSQVWLMRLSPTSASNTYSLQKTFVEVRGQDITLALLCDQRKQDLEIGKRSWVLDELLQGLDGFTRGIFRQTYDLVDAFIVSDIESSTVVYGYTTRIVSNRPIQESDRLRKPFPTRGGRFKAYLIKSTGRGLVLVFDKSKIAEVVQSNVPVSDRRAYDELANDELLGLETGIFQENLDRADRFPITSALHAIEHALFKKATDEAGLEVFAAKTLIRDAAIVLFERQDVGEGGIIQLVAGQQFLRLANNIYSELSSCSQDCEKGCLACTFITDFNCAPFLETECQRWYPGNSFLDRSLASRIFGLSSK